jgi:RNA polymerase sigma-70 factor (ECF subfamily)
MDAESDARLLDLRKALINLPATHRAVIVLVYLLQFELQECATILQIPEGTVKSRLSRARQSLAKAIGDDYDG